MFRSLSLGWFAFTFIALLAVAQDDPPAPPKKRFNVPPDLKNFPQAQPKDALDSIVKAIQKKNVRYLAAQLADPKFVDSRVDELKASIAVGSDDDKQLVAFDKIVREFEGHFSSDPQILRELRIFAKEAEWETPKDDQAVGAAKSIAGRKVFLRKIEGRWFLENRQQ